MTSALLYTRQSRVVGDDELAVLRQADDGRRLAQQRDWTIAHTWSDSDYSASGTRHRPGFEALLREIETGQHHAVIAWALDRLTRNARDRLRIVEACARHGVIIALVRGADIDPSTPGGRLVAGILGEVAEHEIGQKADRQRRAARQAAEAGLPYGGRRPFGYQGDRMTVHEPEAEALRAAYRGVLDGLPLGRIARGLNDAGHVTTQPRRHRHGCGNPNPDGAWPCERRSPSDCPLRIGGDPSPWTTQNLRPVLLAPRYAGQRARSVRGEHGRPEWQIIGPAKWPAVVDLDTWEAVRDVLTAPERRTPPRSGQAMLTGLAVCGVPGCGATVHGGRTRDGAKIYRCSAVLGHLGRRQAPVDEFVSALVCERLSRPDAAEVLTPVTAATEPLRAKLVIWRAKLAAAPGLWREGVLTDDELRDTKGDLRRRIAEAEETLAGSRVVTMLRPLLDADDVSQVWYGPGYDDDRRRAVIDVLFSEVILLPPGRGVRTFRPETVQIVWRRT